MKSLKLLYRIVQAPDLASLQLFLDGEDVDDVEEIDFEDCHDDEKVLENDSDLIYHQQLTR